MTKPRISQVLFWMLAVGTLAFFGFFLALVGGAIPLNDPDLPRGTEAVPVAQTATADEPATTAVIKQVQQTTTASASTSATKTTAASALATVVVRAARGDCWISARLGSENGPVLEERLLAQGESVTLRGARVWMSIGASANVDVTVNGQERQLESGTVAVVLGPT